MRILFDLDGTLTDSRPGILRCFAYAMENLGRGSESVLPFACIGPTLHVAFRELLQTRDAQLIERAIALYRERFESIGMFENSLFPGVPETLATLASRGHRLRIVTSKASPYATAILAHFEIESFFDGVHAPELSDRTSQKGEWAAIAMGEDHPGRCLMIGDRRDDIEAARVNGIRSIAVAWGYASKSELALAGPTRVVNTMAELLQCVDSLETD